MNPSETSIFRPSVKEIDAILGKQFPVLNDGFVRVIDYMGNDQAIVQAARVSYGEGTKKTSEDRGLIRYLLRQRHTTPFEMCELKLHVRVPMDAWRQWIRHRTASVNEYSTRYSVAINATQTTNPENWRLQGIGNKQGSEGFLEKELGRVLTLHETELQNKARAIYQERLDSGVAREQARKDLPLCTYTEAYWKIDLHNLLHFLGLRMDPHAQQEIRAYADVIGKDIVSKWVPLTWESFNDYILDANSFSGPDKNAIALLLRGIHPYSPEMFAVYGTPYPQKFNGPHPKHREISELLQKVHWLGLESLLNIPEGTRLDD